MSHKNKTLHRHIHPIHWHSSMVVAIVAILLTSFKCSGEMMRALHGTVPVHSAVMESLHLRDAETRHSHTVFATAMHPSIASGK